MKQIFYISVLLIWSSSLRSQTLQNKTTHGSSNGILMAIGGGGDDAIIMEEFKKYAGGDSSKIIVIPTALPDNFLEKDSIFYKIKKYFKNYGFKDVSVLHARDSTKANDPQFIEPLKTATGIFFMGGRQWRLADAFLNTKTHKELFKLLERGGIIAGSSAGATIQGSYLARGDTNNNQIMMGDHETGLGFISNIAIDQHVLARNRQFDMFDILKNRPELLGVGIDENTAIVVKGDTLEVIGKSYVLIYDNTFWSREGSDLKNLPDKDNLFYFLKAGDRYHLPERKILKN